MMGQTTRHQQDQLFTLTALLGHTEVNFASSALVHVGRGRSAHVVLSLEAVVAGRSIVQTHLQEWRRIDGLKA